MWTDAQGGQLCRQDRVRGNSLAGCRTPARATPTYPSSLRNPTRAPRKHAEAAFTTFFAPMLSGAATWSVWTTDGRAE
eukprot:365698-Chlamydomonas_euryale.AAC.3